MTRTRPFALRAVLTCAVVAVSVTACGGDPGPSQAELRASSDTARDEVIRTADEAMAAFADLNPDRVLTAETGGRDHWSFDCGDTPAPTGKAIEWVAGRSAKVDEGEPTETMLDPVVDKFVADGWEIHDRKDDDTVSVQLTRDGYLIDVKGDHIRAPGYPPRVTASVYSPCLAAPTPYPED